MKVKIKKWNGVATWRWDIPDDDVCGICQVHFDGTCPTCKYPGDDCSLLSGKCGHNFHMVIRANASISYRTDWWQHCIVEWIKQDSSKGQCPMCRQSRCREYIEQQSAKFLSEFEWTNTSTIAAVTSP
ncbi:hypothetical protein BUE80_DR002256 [Diplocarpon rosae]|nr:hypothetical protein BUE80_DR002256 [Diplocarpon rosae]